MRQLLWRLPGQCRHQARPRQAFCVQLRFLQRLRHLRNRMPVWCHQDGAGRAVTAGRLFSPIARMARIGRPALNRRHSHGRQNPRNAEQGRGAGAARPPSAAQTMTSCLKPYRWAGRLGSTNHAAFQPICQQNHILKSNTAVVVTGACARTGWRKRSYRHSPRKSAR